MEATLADWARHVGTVAHNLKQVAESDISEPLKLLVKTQIDLLSRANGAIGGQLAAIQAAALEGNSAKVLELLQTDIVEETLDSEAESESS